MKISVSKWLNQPTRQSLGIGATCLAISFVSIPIHSQELSLQEQLQARASQSKMPPEIKEKMSNHQKGLAESDLLKKALKVGDKAPDFELKNQNGASLSLHQQLKQGPVILTWYRGGW